MVDPIEIMKQAYASNYMGSISDLIANAEAEEMQQMDIARTEEEAAIGLSEGPQRSMAFPDAGGKNFNTMDMDYPIDITGLSEDGGLVQSYKNVPPGVGNIPMGEKVDTVIENPTQYKLGGYKQNSTISRADKLRSYKCGGKKS
tara:strand:- start:1632 stop:2063 length:432 start_codon:yes stop_codon:yes gene_type:complete